MDRWRIYLYFKRGGALVTYPVPFIAFSFEYARQWADENLTFKRSKSKGVLYKKWGDKRRIYSQKDYEWHYGGYKQKKKEPPKPPKPKAIPLPPPPSPQQKPMWDDEQWKERQAKRRL